MEIPKREDLLDPAKRDDVLADAAIALVAGELTDRQVNALKVICKEIRDNSDLQTMHEDVKRLIAMGNEIERRLKRGESVDLEGIVDRLLAPTKATDG